MVELTFSAPASVVEAASDLLLDVHDALSVSVEDADAGTDHERPGVRRAGLDRRRRELGACGRQGAVRQRRPCHRCGWPR